MAGNVKQTDRNAPPSSQTRAKERSSVDLASFATTLALLCKVTGVAAEEGTADQTAHGLETQGSSTLPLSLTGCGAMCRIGHCPT